MAAISPYEAEAAPGANFENMFIEVPYMRKFLSLFAVIFLIIFVAHGCRMFGPSEKDVFEAIQVVMRGFENSMNQDNMEIKDTYSNSADAVFRNEDDSAVTSMTAIVNDNQMLVYGTSIFSEYQDPSTDYQLDGEFNFNIKSLKPYSADSWFGEMDCSVELAGGKIETLEFSFLIDESGEVEEYFITANDVDLDLDEKNSFIDILERFTREMPG